MVFHWSQLKVIGSNWVVKATALTPFVGYLILISDDIRRYLTLTEGVLRALFEYSPKALITITFLANILELTNGSSSLTYLFSGLFLIGVGAFLFRLFVPELVRVSVDSMDYIDRSMKYATDGQVVLILQRNVKEGARWWNQPEFRWMSTEIREEIDASLAEAADVPLRKEGQNQAEWLSANAAALVGCFRRQYLYVNRSRPILRWTIGLLFSVGFIIMSIPAATLVVATLVAVLF